MPFDQFKIHFETLRDPRVARTRYHDLRNLIFISILAMICGEESWEDISDFAAIREEWLSTFLHLPHGVACADTYQRVWSAIDPKQFNDCFMRWMQSLVGTTEGTLVAIDGKTIRGSGTEERPPLHLVSAWMLENNLVLGQVATDDKSNEITAIPELLKLLELRGRIVHQGAQMEA